MKPDLEHVMIEQTIIHRRFLGFDATEWSVWLPGITAAGLIMIIWMWATPACFLALGL